MITMLFGEIVINKIKFFFWKIKNRKKLGPRKYFY